MSQNRPLHPKAKGEQSVDEPIGLSYEKAKAQLAVGVVVTELLSLVGWYLTGSVGALIPPAYVALRIYGDIRKGKKRLPINRRN